MPKRETDLFEGIAAFLALVPAALRAAKGKRGKPGKAAFLAGLETELRRLERELQSSRYRPGEAHEDRKYSIRNIASSPAGQGNAPRRRVLREIPRPLPPCPALRHIPLLSRDRSRDPQARPAVPASLVNAPFVLMPGGQRRLPEDNVRRFRNRLRGLRDRWRRGTVERDEVLRHVRSWIAHAEHANTWRLRQSIFRAGWFDPAREPDPPPSAFCAAAPGTTIRGTSAPRTGTGTPPATATTTTGSVWPARSTAGTGGVKAPPGAR